MGWKWIKGERNIKKKTGEKFSGLFVQIPDQE